MARIRSDKPEAYQSETLAEVSLAAERTFKGMATIADDRGRLADKPAQINGELWSMRGNHSRDDLEAELDEMVQVDLVCRYAGCDGKRYLHLVRWDQHQKIDRPSKSRLPRCPHHQLGPDDCGRHEGDCEPVKVSQEPDAASRDTREGSRVLSPPQNGLDADAGADESPAQGELIAVGEQQGQADASSAPEQGKRKSSRETREPSMQDLGSRTVDRGSRTVDLKAAQPPAVADEPRPTDDELTLTQRSKRLTDAYAEAEPMCKWVAVNGVVLSAVKSGKFSDDEIRAALLRLAAENRSVTIDQLRTELVGFPAPRGRSNRRGGASDDLSREVYGQGRTRI